MTMNDNSGCSALAVVVVLGAVLLPQVVKDPSSGLIVLGAFAAVGIGLTGLFYVGQVVGDRYDRRRARKTTERVQRLLELLTSADADDQAMALDLFERLSKLYAIQTQLEAAAGFREAAQTAGPEQIPALRLALVNMWPGKEPWATILEGADEMLDSLDLTERERGRLGRWREERA